MILFVGIDPNINNIIAIHLFRVNSQFFFPSLFLEAAIFATIEMMKPALIPRSTSDSIAETSSDDSLILSIPAGRKGKYRWAQFDDYLYIPRTNFEWIPPIHFSLEARCTNPNHQGTWGFGFWNDPFNISLGVKGSVKRLPVLPNCAWFFFASENNYLSFESKLPAQGFLAATFSSPLIPSLLFAPTLPFLPLLINKHFARFARNILSIFVKQDASLMDIDVTDWHTYQINWQNHNVQFLIDDQMILSTSKSPKGKLGIVIWVDNQYAAFKPCGQIAFGTLASHTDTTLEIKNLVVKQKNATIHQVASSSIFISESTTGWQLQV